MSHLENAVLSYENPGAMTLRQDQFTEVESDELTICISQVVRHQSPMPEHLKMQKRKNADSLEQILEQVIEQKGESGNVEIYRNKSNELEIDGLSQQTLHCFLLKAEELGKNLTYSRSLKVCISDQE